MPKVTDPYERQHIKNLAQYGKMIDKIFRAATQEAAQIGALVGTSNFDPSRVFSFKDYPITLSMIQSLLSRLADSVETAVVNGIEAEWTLANNKNNALSQRVFGDNIGRLTQEQYRRYFSTNDDARQAFIGRKEQGLNLSERVWNYAQGFKNDIELGLDLGIRNGLDADAMSRELRQFLRYPDKLFRRVRDLHGNLVLSQRAADFHPGQGVYRSSYKNARRLAVTETNMAYRTADYERMQQLDFVVGIEIRLSNNHTCNGVPLTDICDDLCGRYPKDFKFTGWHPHCRCHVVQILKTEAELMEENRAILLGVEPTTDSVNRVSDVPQAFNEWMKDNTGRMERAKSLPYFIRDNERYVREAKHHKTVLEIAEERHAARTPEQTAEIRERWSRRRAVHHYGENMLRYFEGILDVDTTPLLNAVRSGNIDNILIEGRKLKAVGKEILSYKYIDNPMQVARQFSMSEAKAVNEAVQKKLDGWTGLSLGEQKSKLSFEIDWLQKHQKYSTWEVAQKAYKKRLERVSDALDWENIGNEFKSISSFKTKSKPYHDLVTKLQDAISGKDKAAAQQTILDIRKKREQLDKAAAERNAKKLFGKGLSTTFDENAYTKERKDKAIWCKTSSSSVNKFKDKADDIYNAASKEEKDAAWRYTSGSGYVNRPLRGYDGAWGKFNFKGVGNVPLDNESPLAPKDIDSLTSLINKSTYDKDIWLQRGVDNDGLAGFLQLASLDKNSLNALVGQSITDTAFMSCGAAKGTGFDGNIINIYCPKGTKMLYIDGRSAYASENEMLIQRNTRFRITKVEKTDWRYFIDVEVVGQI